MFGMIKNFWETSDSIFDFIFSLVVVTVPSLIIIGILLSCPILLVFALFPLCSCCGSDCSNNSCCD